MEQPREVSDACCTQRSVRSTGDLLSGFVLRMPLWDGGAALQPTAASPCSPPQHSSQSSLAPCPAGAQGEQPQCCSAVVQPAQDCGSRPARDTGPAPALLFPHPRAAGAHRMAQSQGTFQRHFSNSHYPPCKDHRPAFSSAWLLFRPHFLSSVDAFFQLKEEGAWVLLGLSLAGKESTHALHVLCRLLQSLVDPFPGTQHRLCLGHSTERCHCCTGGCSDPMELRVCAID